MKHAAAMKYGGELVAADDCTYDSYLLLGTLCPECKEPVYLKSGGDRVSVKGTPYKIGPHFSHRKGTSEEQVASCETRVSNYTDKDRQRIAAKAKGQRLKLLQRWFWIALRAAHFPSLDDQSKINLSSFGSMFDAYVDVYPTKDFRIYAKQIACSLTGITTSALDVQSHVDLMRAFGQLSSDKLALSSMSHIPGYEVLVKAQCEYITEVFSSSIDIKVGSEAISFLMAKSSVNILEDVVMAFILTNFETGACKTIEEVKGFIQCEKAAKGLKVYVFNLVLCIPWASEFQRLEAESQQRKGAA